VRESATRRGFVQNNATLGPLFMTVAVLGDHHLLSPPPLSF
jgi:hypothetical protein